MGFGGGADFQFHTLACESAFHHGIVGFCMVYILHEPLALQLGNECGHGAVHAYAQKFHRLRLAITDSSRKNIKERD